MDLHAKDWGFQSSGPVSGANQALPWIVFERDLEKFQSKFPSFLLRKRMIFMAWAYILGGGFSLRASLPGFLYPGIRRLEEKLLDSEKWGMFALIVVEKVR